MKKPSYKYFFVKSFFLCLMLVGTLYAIYKLNTEGISPEALGFPAEPVFFLCDSQRFESFRFEEEWLAGDLANSCINYLCSPPLKEVSLNQLIEFSANLEILLKNPTQVLSYKVYPGTPGILQKDGRFYSNKAFFAFLKNPVKQACK